MWQSGRRRRLARNGKSTQPMTDSDLFRAQAARCLTLRRVARRGDVQQALQSLAQEYEAKARAMALGGRGDVAAPTCTRLALVWPVMQMQRNIAALLRMSFAFWLSLWPPRDTSPHA
jgi:hypothetical protein